MKNIKILIVEDSGTKRDLYKNQLTKEGYSIIEAKDGEEGLSKARSEFPDVVITDIEMPKINGLKLVELLKKDERTKYIPVICVSATFKDVETKINALIEAGAEDYFYMPENMEELIVKVRVMLRIRALYAELIERNKQLKQFNDVVVNRELKMIELKAKVKKLEEELAKYKK